MINMEIKRARRIEQETALFCLDDCIATLAGYYQCDYEMMYIGGFGIFAKPDIPGFASRYDLWLLNRFDNLRKYHGLAIEKCDFYWKHSIIKQIRTELEAGRPMLLLQNPYWCPWDDGYQRYDAVPGHCFLIQGECEGGFLCIDPYFEKDQLLLPFSLFKKGVQEVYRTEQIQEAILSPEKSRELLENMFKNIFTQGYLGMLNSFVMDMEQAGDLFESVRPEGDFWISPLAVLLLKVNQSIQNISTVTGYVAEICKSVPLKRLGERFWNLAIKWKQARKLVIKLYFMKRQDDKLKAKTIERLASIIVEMEEAVSGTTEEIKETTDTPKIEAEEDKLAQAVLELKEYMNNKAFLTRRQLEEGKWDADFSSIGHCYIMENVETLEVLCDPGHKIALPEAGKEGDDNIACTGQEIKIQKGRYAYIDLIGAAEFGNSSDIIKLISPEGREFEVEFQFTDYIYEPCFGETVVWKGQGIHKQHDGYEWMPETLYLYRQRLRMPDAVIDRIILPINPSIHIFAVVCYFE